ncbi:MAG: ABC-F type ribosomal protection protein [Eubacteriales bacterium]|jgi:ATP-binding cassette subfamily F protein 3
MLLSCQDITKTFDGSTVLDHVSFHLEKHDRAALIGINGAGKSTLLKIIVGEMEPDEGQTILPGDVTTGYLAQYQDTEDTCTIYEEVRKSKEYLFDMEKELRAMEQQMKNASAKDRDALMDRYTALTHQFELENGYAAESEITGVLRGLGFEEEDFDRPLSSLSGGQKTRVVLGRLLLTKPDLLILDEPTNHLDMTSVEWLENYLRSYQGTVLVVSHDRYFLNRFVNRVIELENGHAETFQGSYDDYSSAKAIIRRARRQAYAKQQEEIRHQEAVIRKLKQFNREKSIRRAESREKMLSKIDRLEKPAEDPDTLRIRLVPSIESGNQVLTCEHISKSFPGQTLFRDQSFEIRKGERVAIIGNNGTGKSTMLKIITGLLSPDSGEVTFGAHVHVGYYDQEQQLLHDDRTIFEEISDAFPGLDNTRIRTVLAAFLFTGDDVFKLIGSLSGGERGRVSLAKLMLSQANFLILDEPTNHLDISSRGILEDALCDYTGTVLYVSHDRYFINRTATRILDLCNGEFVQYLGNYDYYLEKRDEKKQAEAAAGSGNGSFSGEAVLPDGSEKVSESGSGQSDAPSGKNDWQAQKEEAARRRRLENEIRKTEDRITLLESRNEEINSEFLKPEISTDPEKLRTLTEEQTANNRELEQLYEQWEKLSGE